MAAEANGLATALRLLAAAGNTGADRETQDDLFEAAAPLPLGPARGVSGPQGGRPLGARNKSTDEWVKYFLSKYPSPLTMCAELYTRPLGELVDELQAMADKHKSWIETKAGGHWERVAIDPLAVLKLQRDAGVALLPYIHKQQPKSIEIDKPQRGLMVLDLGAEDGEVMPDDDLALPLAPAEENQALTGRADVKSESKKSDGI